MRFWSNKHAERVAVGTRHMNSGLKVMLLNGRKTGAAVTTGGVVTLASSTGLKIGMLCEQRSVDGAEAVITTNIPANRKILTVDSGTQVTLDGVATSGSGLTLYFHPDRDMNTADQVSGIEVGQSPNVAHVGYTPGYGSASRKTLASVVAAEDDTNDWALVTAAVPTWAATFGPGWTTGYAFIYETGGSDPTAEFCGFSNDGGFPSFANGNAFPLTGFDTTGFARITT